MTGRLSSFADLLVPVQPEGVFCATLGEAAAARRPCGKQLLRSAPDQSRRRSGHIVGRSQVSGHPTRPRWRVLSSRDLHQDHPFGGRFFHRHPRPRPHSCGVSIRCYHFTAGVPPGVGAARDARRCDRGGVRPCGTRKRLHHSRESRRFQSPLRHARGLRASDRRQQALAHPQAAAAAAAPQPALRSREATCRPPRFPNSISCLAICYICRGVCAHDRDRRQLLGPRHAGNHGLYLDRAAYRVGSVEQAKPELSPRAAAGICRTRGCQAIVGRPASPDERRASIDHRLRYVRGRFFAASAISTQWSTGEVLNRCHHDRAARTEAKSLV